MEQAIYGEKRSYVVSKETANKLLSTGKYTTNPVKRPIMWLNPAQEEELLAREYVEVETVIAPAVVDEAPKKRRGKRNG